MSQPTLPEPISSLTEMCIVTVSDSAGKDIVNRLLDKREVQRLGSRSGASEVKQHKWFAKTNWGLLRNAQPPVRHRPPISFSRLRVCPGAPPRERTRLRAPHPRDPKLILPLCASASCVPHIAYRHLVLA